MKKRINTIILMFIIGATLLSCGDTAPAAPAASSDGTTAATTTAVTTVDRDTLTDPNLSDIEVEIITAMWEKYKNKADPPFTINDISLNQFFEPCGDAYVLFVTDFIPPLDMLTRETVGGCEFRYSDSISLSAYHNGKFYSLQEAYASGIITDDQLHAVWEAYKTKFAARYDSDSWDDEEDEYETEDSAEQ